MMPKVGTLFALVVTLLESSCALRQHDFLDATKATVRPEPGHQVEVGGVFLGPTRSLPEGWYPLQVRLLRLDRRGYRRMDRMEYELSITNLSTEAIVLPWSPLPINRRDRPASGYRHVIFEFMIVKPDQPEAVAHSFVLYGAPTVPGSLKELRPDETAVVRLPGILSGSGFVDARNPVLLPTTNMQAKVGMSVFAPGDRWFKDFHEEYSENTLPITIVGGQVPPQPDIRRTDGLEGPSTVTAQRTRFRDDKVLTAIAAAAGLPALESSALPLGYREIRIRTEQPNVCCPARPMLRLVQGPGDIQGSLWLFRTLVLRLGNPMQREDERCIPLDEQHICVRPWTLSTGDWTTVADRLEQLEAWTLTDTCDRGSAVADAGLLSVQRRVGSTLSSYSCSGPRYRRTDEAVKAHEIYEFFTGLGGVIPREPIRIAK